MVSLYYKKIEKIPESIKQADYTVQFRTYGHLETVIFEDITGAWTVGEKLPVYFLREITDSKGRKWKAIEKEGITYRAMEAPLYRQTAHGIAYRQIIIQYITGDSSESKLKQWKKRAQEKKDEFYGTSPCNYFLTYREKNSWNDIGLKFDVANKGSTIGIEAEEFDGWVIPSEKLGTFSLSKNGQVETAWYERADNNTSLGDRKRSYTVHIADSEGTDLAEPYTGQLAFKKGNSVCDFQIYYPGLFYDHEGSRWEAEEPGPKTFLMSALDTNEVVDTFELGGIPYTISRVVYQRIWNQKTCTHEWECGEELKGNCLTAAHRILACGKCGKEMETIYPATGHRDEDLDSLCDVCGVRLTQNLGDEITVTWDSGELGHGKLKYHFVCIDTDYEGTGNMLYICEEGIGSDIYGDYATGDSADYASSALRYFLDDRFAGGLSITGNLQAINGDAVSILTKDEYDFYCTAGENRNLEGRGSAGQGDRRKAVFVPVCECQL